MSNFVREFSRYVVFKARDLRKVEQKIGSPPVRAVREVKTAIDSMRALEGKPRLECVVIESDWRCYEAAWRLVERDAVGKPFFDDENDADGQVRYYTDRIVNMLGDSQILERDHGIYIRKWLQRAMYAAFEMGADAMAEKATQIIKEETGREKG